MDFDLTWGTLLSNREADYLMVASCGNEKLLVEEFSEIGLVSRHDYSILDVVNVDECR